MKLTKGTIENLGNVEKETFKFSAVNIFQGRNASGKSSRINAIRSVFIKGDNKDLIRQDCESGYCELFAVDGEDEYRYLKTFFYDKPAKLQIWINGHEQSAPQRMFDLLRNADTIDLHSWLSLKEESKSKALLESMLLRVDMEKINDLIKNITGGNKRLIENAMPGEDVHAIEFIDKLDKMARDLRRDDGRQLKKDKAYLENLEGSIEEFDTDKNWSQEAEKFDAEIQKLQADRYTEQEKIQSKYQKQIETVKDNKSVEEGKVAEKYHEITEKYHKQIDDLKQEMNDKLSEKVSSLEEQINEVSASRAEASTKAEEHTRIKVIQKQIETAKKEVVDLQEKYDVMDRLVFAIPRYKKSLLENIPVKGVSFDKGRLTLDGLPLVNVNTARLIELSLEITSLKMPANGLRFAYVDGIEALDTGQLKGLIASAKEKDIELLMGKTADTDLELLTEDSFKGE